MVKMFQLENFAINIAVCYKIQIINTFVQTIETRNSLQKILENIKIYRNKKFKYICF